MSLCEAHEMHCPYLDTIANLEKQLAEQKVWHNPEICVDVQEYCETLKAQLAERDEQLAQTAELREKLAAQEAEVGRLFDVIYGAHYWIKHSASDSPAVLRARRMLVGALTARREEGKPSA